MAKKATATLDQQLQELEALVNRMEKGELGLEEALGEFERGVGLLRSCESQLRQAEQKVQILMQQPSGQETLRSFHAAGPAAAAPDAGDEA